jgi:hypothetical protein
MKYIVGASIGGLFGFSMPFIMDISNIEDVKDSRLEEPQPVEEAPLDVIDPSLILPDNFCEYIEYKSTDPREQAKECLRRSIVAVPSI